MLTIYSITRFLTPRYVIFNTGRVPQKSHHSLHLFISRLMLSHPIHNYLPASYETLLYFTQDLRHTSQSFRNYLVVFTRSTLHPSSQGLSPFFYSSLGLLSLYTEYRIRPLDYVQRTRISHPKVYPLPLPTFIVIHISSVWLYSKLRYQSSNLN